jgi:hypothetical protein
MEPPSRDNMFPQQQMWRLSQTPCKRTMVERRIGHRIAVMIICCNNGRGGLAGGTDVLRVFHPCGSREEGNTHDLLVVLTGVEPDGRGRTPPESRHHAATEMNFGLREKYAEIMVFEEIIRYSPRRRALPCIAEGFSPTASAVERNKFSIPIISAYGNSYGDRTLC